MAGPIRYTPQVFGGSLTPTGNVGVFGSKALGAPAFSTSPQVIQSPAWLQGIFGALAAGDAPYWQDENGFRLVVTYLLAYLANRGIPEWDYNLASAGPPVVSMTTYNAGDVVRRGPNPAGPHVTIWQVIPTSNGITSDPLVDGTNWQTLAASLASPNVIKAWVNFSGTAVTAGNCQVRCGLNIGTVQKIATGWYRINFATPLPADGSGNGLYAPVGSAGAVNGAPSLAGDNNTVNFGGPPGTTVIKTANQLDVFNWEPNQGGSGALEDSDSISVQIFG